MFFHASKKMPTRGLTRVLLILNFISFHEKCTLVPIDASILVLTISLQVFLMKKQWITERQISFKEI